MKEAEAQRLIDRRVRIVLTSGFRYNGFVLTTTEETLILKDKFANEVSIRLSDISTCEQLTNEDFEK